MRVVHRFDVLDESIDRFAENYKRIGSELKEEGFELYLSTDFSRFYCIGDHEKVKPTVFRVIRKYKIEVRSGDVAFLAPK